MYESKGILHRDYPLHYDFLKYELINIPLLKIYEICSPEEIPKVANFNKNGDLIFPFNLFGSYLLTVCDIKTENPLDLNA